MNKKREGFTLPHFKTYCKAIVIKCVIGIRIDKEVNGTE